MMKREPLTREALVAAVAALVAQGLVVWGLPLTPDQVAWLQAVIVLAALGWTVLRARPQVTPVADPRGANGEPLVSREAG
jgi:hypothetical protein